MKSARKTMFLMCTLTAFWLMDFSSVEPVRPVFVADAGAVVGRPLTPVSAAGVARRTTRRAVYATSASTSAAAAQQQPAPAPAPAAAAAPPSGTVVTALPAGCESVVMDGVNLFNCSGVYYEPKFQSNNLVYVVK